MSPPTLIKVAGRTTRVRIDGDHSGPPLVLLHGIGRSLEDWSPAIVALAERRRVISLARWLPVMAAARLKSVLTKETV